MTNCTRKMRTQSVPHSDVLMSWAVKSDQAVLDASKRGRSARLHVDDQCGYSQSSGKKEVGPEK